MKARDLVIAARRARQTQGAPLPKPDAGVPRLTDSRPATALKPAVPSHQPPAGHSRQGAS